MAARRIGAERSDSKRRLTLQEHRDLRRQAATAALAEARAAVAAAVEMAASDPLVVKALGIIAYREGKFQESALHFTDCLNSGEADAETMLYLARALYNIGDDAACRRAAQAYLAEVPDTADALRILARVSMRQDDFETSERAWAELTRVKTDDTEAPLQVARLRVRRGDAKGAMQLAAEAHRRCPAAAEPIAIQVGAAMQLGRFDAVPELLASMAQADGRGAAALLRDLGRIAGSNALMAAGKAIAAIRATGKVDAELSVAASEMVQQWRVGALRAELTRDDRSAASFLRPLAVCDAENPAVGDAIARFRGYSSAKLREAMRGNDQAAIVAAADHVLELDPSAADAWLAKGRALLMGGENEAALEPLEQAVALKPESGWTLLNLTRATWRLRQYARAIELAERAMSLTSDLKPEHAEEARNIRDNSTRILAQEGSRLLRRHDLRGALDVAASLERCGQALAAEPIRTLALYELYRTVKRGFRDELANTRELAELYLREDPKHEEIKVVLCRVLMKAAEFEPALTLWQELSQAHPGNAHYMLQVARCHRRMGQHGLAAEAAHRVLALDPSVVEATDIIARSGL